MLSKVMAFFLLAGGLQNQVGPTQQRAEKHPNLYPMSMIRSVDFNYLIYANQLFSPEDPERCKRNLYLLMDENAFNEENLKELFGVLSDAFPEPKQLSIPVHTSLEQVRPLGPTGQSEQSDPPNSHKHHLATYLRMGENEFFRYIAPPQSGKWTTVVLRGVDPVPNNDK